MRVYQEFSLKRIMVAADFSGASYSASWYAKQLATHFSAKILLVHVIDTKRIAGGAEHSEANIPEQIDLAEDELWKIEEGLSEDGIRCAMIVRAGNIPEIVPDLVRERDVDLLVVGTRGEDREESLFVSIAERLLRATPCPVLIVGKHVRLDACEGTHARSVLFPTDFSQLSRGALMYAESLTKYLGGHLLLLHVDEKQTTERREEFQELIKEMKDPSALVECIAAGGDPVDTIVAVAEEKRVDFIVMGVHEASQANLESNHGIVFDIIRQARCPVLTLITQPWRKVTPIPGKEMTEAEEFHRQQERLSIRYS